MQNSVSSTLQLGTIAACRPFFLGSYFISNGKLELIKLIYLNHIKKSNNQNNL